MTATTQSTAFVKQSAGRLLDAFETGRPIEPLTKEHPSLTVDGAYAIQRELVERHGALGRRVVGRKIGLTSPAIQQQLGVDSPDYGVVLDSHAFQSGVRLSRADAHMIAPRLEAELAFVLGRALQGPNVTASEVLDATEAIVPVFEVIDSRIAEWRIRLEDTVADNASCYGVVTALGSASERAGDLRATSVRIERDGETLVSGEGIAVMGDPSAAVAWLANELSRFDTALPEGQLVLSGSFTAAVDAVPGSYRAEFSAPLAPVEVTIEP